MHVNSSFNLQAISHIKYDMPVGVRAGTNVGGAYILWAAKRVESKEC